VRILANFPTGRAFAFDVPDWIDPTVDTSSVVTLDGRPRTISYIAYSRRPAPAEERVLAHEFDVFAGAMRVRVYRTLDGSEALRAYWQFPAGSLATFLQDDSGCGADLGVGMRMIVAHVDVGLSRGGLPTIRLREPLRGGDPRNPLERDAIHLWPRQDPGKPNFKLTLEPPWVMEGRQERRSDNSAVVSASNSLGVTVRAIGPASDAEEMRRDVEAMSRSMAPAA
jgi:hypothetical protein